MAKKTPRSSKPLAFKPGTRRKSLIEWNDPSRQAQVLDWTHRAKEFGLTVDEHEDEEREAGYDEPQRVLADQDPEAFTEQAIPGPDDDFAAPEEEEERPLAAGVSREDVDLVRVYLQHIGKRKLLKAQEEVALGQRIEDAQRQVVAALAEIPGAVQTLIALADRIRTKGDPAAELILLPEGGELREDQITPVLRAFNRIKKRRCLVDSLREKLGSPRLGVKTRAEHEKQIERTRKAIASDLAAQPLRPSLIDDTVAELRQVDEEFRNLEHVPRAERAERCRALETRTGLPRAEFRRRFAKVEAAD